MDIFNPSNLATGGIIAVVIGFWQQAKNLASYVSSFLIIQASFDPNTSRTIVNYLKKEYKVGVSGIFNFSSVYCKLPLLNKYAYVPFRRLNQINVFYKGLSVFVGKVDAGMVHIYAIRGTLDLEGLINKSLDFDEELDYASQKISSRFYIEKIIGSEKGMWGDFNNRKSGGEVPGSPQRETCLPDGLDQPNINLDKSFRYEPSDYRWTNECKPFESLYYDPEVDHHIKQAGQWFSTKEWCEQRSIPWRRGWLIHGPGGTGKSSLSLALGQSLGVPIYQYMLATLSDQEFMREWGNMGAPCIALFEDFDTVFDKREPLTEHKSLTFDCILNTISGVSSRDGVFLIVTTNDIEKIDPAMGVSTLHGTISTRPGRIDQVIYLGAASDVVRSKIINRILQDWPDIHQQILHQSRSMTIAQTQELCIQQAYERM